MAVSRTRSTVQILDWRQVACATEKDARALSASDLFPHFSLSRFFYSRPFSGPNFGRWRAQTYSSTCPVAVSRRLLIVLESRDSSTRHSPSSPRNLNVCRKDAPAWRPLSSCVRRYFGYSREFLLTFPLFGRDGERCSGNGSFHRDDASFDLDRDVSSVRDSSTTHSVLSKFISESRENRGGSVQRQSLRLLFEKKTKRETLGRFLSDSSKFTMDGVLKSHRRPRASFELSIGHSPDTHQFSNRSLQRRGARRGAGDAPTRSAARGDPPASVGVLRAPHTAE